jgi:hypothetical protein
LLLSQGFPRFRPRGYLLHLLDEIHQPETGSAPSIAIGPYFGNLRFQLGNLNGDRSGRLQGHLCVDGMDRRGHRLIEGMN